MEVLEKIKTQIADFDEKRKALLAELKNEFAPMVAPLFEKHPKIESFSWTQYTPYFNDGDECVFSTNFDYSLEINGENEDDIESLGKHTYRAITEKNYAEHVAYNTAQGSKYYLNKNIGDTGCFENTKFDQELHDGIEEFKTLLSSIPDDFYKDLFGDHVRVTVKNTNTIKI
jgi:hypothetical protein